VIVGESVTRLRPAGTDAYGDPIAEAPGELDIAGCALAPRSSSDVTDQGRQGVIAGMTLFAPAGADIEATDQIVARGATWTIEGEVGDWRNPHTGAQPGLEVALKRVAG
jgi:hypothetical protein